MRISQPPAAKARETQGVSSDVLPMGNWPPVTNSAKSAAKNGAKFLTLWADAVSSDAGARKRVASLLLK